MSDLSLIDILKITQSDWKPVSFTRTAGDMLTRWEDAVAAFLDGFSPKWTLATMQSGVTALRGDQPLPDMGVPLHLEGYSGGETRVLRHLSGSGWRVTASREEDGSDCAAEQITCLGTGEAGDGPVKRLIYRRYWSLDGDGGWHPLGARLAGVE